MQRQTAKNTRSENGHIISHTRADVNSCLSCGTTTDIGRRRYCSINCRQRLRQKLNLQTGLLKALHTRYATFTFTQAIIILDVLPYGAKHIYSFILPRSPHRTPADDFTRLAGTLAEAWWHEKKRSNKDYLATQKLFEKAGLTSKGADSVMPVEMRIPTVREPSITRLRLDKADLASPEIEKIVKNAYRSQAKRHHPDMGGNNAAFRKIQRAYEELLDWSTHPTFIKRSGFPDRWFYRGDRNQWVQPIPKG